MNLTVQIGDFVAALHGASWSTIIGLFCSVGLLIALICMLPLLWLMQRKLKEIGNDLDANDLRPAQRRHETPTQE